MIGYFQDHLLFAAWIAGALVCGVWTAVGMSRRAERVRLQDSAAALALPSDMKFLLTVAAFAALIWPAVPFMAWGLHIYDKDSDR